MNDTASLNAAKTMLREKRFQEAIATFEAVANGKSDASAEAAYCLGIIYHSGEGAPANIDDATQYYLIAEQSGYSMATYRLAGIYNKQCELQKAYDSYQTVAQNNPSAAYWAYRLLALDKNLDTNPNASDKYLNTAAERDHVLAQRIIAMKYISGRNGFLNVPYGLYLFLKMAWNAVRVTSKGEKLKYG
jgi:TPR repeat protein